MGKYFTTKVFRINTSLNSAILKVTRTLKVSGSSDYLKLVKNDSVLTGGRYGCVALDCEKLNEGDIVKIDKNGKIIRLWDITSIHNGLFVSGACNLRCRMCPQPPEADNVGFHYDNLKVLSLLHEGELQQVGITGGEPFLFPDRVIEYFSIIGKRFPRVTVEILTNATRLADFEVAKRIAISAPYNTVYCVSLHADTPQCYEAINQTAGSFDLTVRGIENLAKLRQSIEIRPVITQLNGPFVYEMAFFLWRNFPYVKHVAFMGQELVGDAEKNYEEIWIEPRDYVDSLCRAVSFLNKMGVFASIYNIPLCLLPASHHKYAARSISDWKQGYLKSCEECKKQKECCGFFLTGKNKVPLGIQAFQ